MSVNVEAIVINYVESHTTKDKENILNMLPLHMQNHYVRETLEALHTEHNTLQFPSYNRRYADFMRSMKFALNHNVEPRGFIA